MKINRAIHIMILFFAVLVLFSACGQIRVFLTAPRKMVIPDVEKATAAQDLEKIPDIVFPKEASSVVFYTVSGVDANWGWRQGSLKAEKIPGLFFQKDQLLFAGKTVQGLESLTAEGYFDKKGYAQNMTVQGWSGIRGDKPIFQIFIYRLDSKMMKNSGRSPENIVDNYVYDVPVKISWSDTEGISYSASFETEDLSINCVTTATEYHSEEDAKALLIHIIAHCLNSDYGVTLG